MDCYTTLIKTWTQTFNTCQGNFKIQIRPTSHKKFFVIGDGSTTVDEIKEKIILKKGAKFGGEHGLETSQFKLGFKGKQMSEGWRPMCDFDLDTAEVKLIDMVPQINE